jgi:hypothetical protein
MDSSGVTGMFLSSIALLLALLLTSQARTPVETPPSRPPVTFSAIRPMLGPQCQWCHGWEEKGISSGYDMESYDALLDGAYRDGAHRREIIPGDAEHSPFVQYIEGRREPRMPYQREPLSPKEIALLRRWIDDGALPSERTPREHEIKLTDIPVTAGMSFWLSCRAPLKDRHLRVKVVDDGGRVLAYEWPRGSMMDLHGLWDQWQIKVPDDLPKNVTTVSVVLAVSTASGEEQDSDTLLSGTVFILDSGKTPKAQLLRQSDLRAVATPEPPPHRQVDFSFLLRHPADVTLDVYREKDETSVHHWSNIDVPAEETVNVQWPIPTGTNLRRGSYVARIRCKSREKNRDQPSFAILFYLDPRTNATTK